MNIRKADSANIRNNIFVFIILSWTLEQVKIYVLCVSASADVCAMLLLLSEQKKDENTTMDNDGMLMVIFCLEWIYFRKHTHGARLQWWTDQIFPFVINSYKCFALPGFRAFKERWLTTCGGVKFNYNLYLSGNGVEPASINSVLVTSSRLKIWCGKSMESGTCFHSEKFWREQTKCVLFCSESTVWWLKF